MAGKLFFISENSLSDGFYIDHDKRSQWFYTSDSCNEYLINEIRPETISSVEFSCEELCFCKLYRAKIWQAIKELKIKRAWLLFNAGFARMMRS